MTGVVVLFGGILVVCAAVALLDWFARRKDQRSENRPAA